MNSPKSVKRRTAAEKWLDRKMHLIKRHGYTRNGLRGVSYFQMGIYHAAAHIKTTHKEAMKHNA